MKKKILYIALLAGTTLVYSSCSKVSSLISAQTVGWTNTDVSFDVPIITSTAATTQMGTQTVTYNLDSLIKSKTADQLGLANVDEVHLTSCTATITNSDAANNFGNFESVNGTFFSSADPTIAVMGEIDNNPATNVSTLSIPVNSSVNLKSYVSPSGTTTFTYVVSGKARTATTKVLNATLHVEYSIHVKP